MLDYIQAELRMTTKQRTLLAISLAFILPLFGSLLLLHFNKIGQPTHYGKLLADKPPWPDLADPQHNWQLLYIPQNAICQASCWKDLDMLAKLKILLGKQTNKVHIYYTLIDSRNKPKVNPYFTYAPLKSRADILKAYQLDPQQAHWFIVDPLGRIVFHYKPEHVPKKLFADLNKLLKSSRQLNS